MSAMPTLTQRAAELVIEFGLEHTGMTENDLRSSVGGDGLVVLWRVPTAGWHHSEIEMLALRRTGGTLETRTSICVKARDLAHVKQVSAVYARIVDLAERIEALR